MLTERCFSGKSSSEEEDSNGKSNAKNGVETIPDLVEECAIESCSKILAIVVSQPFYTISVRAMAQFIGRENIYGLPFVSSFRVIMRDDGVSGFFAGLVPRLISEMLSLWLGKVLYYLMCKYVFVEDKHQLKTLQPYGRLLVPTMTSHFTYPFALTSTIMAVNGSSLRAGGFPFTPVYNSWLACLRELIANGDTSRGSALFNRVAKL